MSYTKFKKSLETEINAFPMAFAFSNAQLEEAKEKLGHIESDPIVNLGAGCLVLKSKAADFYAMFEDHEHRTAEWLKNPENLKNALVYELGNHEFCISYDDSEALESLGLDFESMTDDQRKTLKEAKKQYLDGVTGW